MCNEDKTKLILEAWKEIVNVQMHFNEIEMKIRGMAITTLTAFIGAAGFILKNNKTIDIQTIFYHNNDLIKVILIIGALIWCAFYFMDRYWYHHLLNGSVYAGIDLEKILEYNNIPVTLGQHIKKESPIHVWCLKTIPIHSDQKLTFFYIFMPLICFLTIKFVFLLQNFFYAIILAILVTYISLVILGLTRLIKNYKKIKYEWLKRLMHLIMLLLPILGIIYFLLK